MSSDQLVDAPPHEFEPQERNPDSCGFEWNGMTCGYDRDEHSHAWAIDWQYRPGARRSEPDPEVEAARLAGLEALNAKPWRGACPLCQFTLWCTDTEEEARELVTAHIAEKHPQPQPQIWRDHE